MLDLNKAAEALNALGPKVDVGLVPGGNGEEYLRLMPSRDYWKPGEIECPNFAFEVMAAVLKVAPGSYAHPVNIGKREGQVCVLIRGYRDWTTDKSPVYAATYTEAWINAAIALNEASGALSGKGETSDPEFDAILSDPAVAAKLDDMAADAKEEIRARGRGKGETV